MVGTIVGTQNQPPKNAPPSTPRDTRMLVDFIASDSHAFGYQFPVVLPPGLARRPRLGQFAVASYAHGYPQMGYILGHAFNNDQHPTYADPWPLTLFPGEDDWSGSADGNIIPNLDDFALYHDETGTFWRLRSAQGASPKTAGPFGGPGIAELRMRSGVVLAFEEYPTLNAPAPPVQPPGQTPPPPLPAAQRAKLTVTMPAGTQVLYDEPEVGIGTLSVTVPNATGATTLTIAQDGTIVLTASNDVTIDAPGQNVQVNVTQQGAETQDAATGVVALGDLKANLAEANASARFSDVKDLTENQITQLIGNSHIQMLHAIVANGGLPDGAHATELLGTLEGGGFPIPSFFPLLPSLSGITLPPCSPTVLVK
jgi:hypothetical protein